MVKKAILETVVTIVVTTAAAIAAIALSPSMKLTIDNIVQLATTLFIVALLVYLIFASIERAYKK